MNKMSIEEFRRIKNRMMEMFSIDARTLTSEEEENLVKEYSSLVDELASHDLSDIPFEEWRGVALFREGELDFSKTHANLDFSIMGESGFEKVNLTGCNIRGLENVYFEEDTFDQSFKDAHPEYFPSKDLPREIVEKFYGRDLSFQDYIDYPNIRKCAHGAFFGGSSKGMIDLIGFDYALRMLDEYQDLILYITKNKDNYRDGILFSKDIKFDGGSYEEAKEAIFKTIIYNIEYYDYHFEIMKTDLIPEEMKKAHPEVFFNDEELPKEIVETYRNGNLSLANIRKYYKDLQNKNIKIGIRSNYMMGNLVTLFGSIDKIVEEMPPELDSAIMYYLNNNWWHDKDDVTAIFNESREEFYKKAIIEYITHSNEYSLYDIRNYSKYIPLERLIGDEVIVQFTNFFGIDNIIQFSNQNDFVLEKTKSLYFSADLSETFLGFLAKQSNISYSNYSNDYAGLEQLVKDVVIFARNNHENKNDVFIDTVMHYGKCLYKLCPNQFMDYDLAKELFKNISDYNRFSLEKNVNDALSGSFKKIFEVLNEYPQAVQLFVNRNIEFVDYPIINEIVQNIGLEQLLNLCLNYKEVFEYCLSTNSDMMNSLINAIKNGETPEAGINEFIYNDSSKKICDYNQLPQSFKDAHPDLFLPDSPDVPERLKKEFVGMKIWGTYDPLSLNDLANNPEWIPFLDNVDLTRCLTRIRIYLMDSSNAFVGSFNNFYDKEKYVNIFEFFGKYMPKKEMLEFLVKYAYLLNDHEVIGFPINELQNNNIKDVFESVIYRRALARSANVSEITVPQEFKDKHPDLFISKDAPDELKNLFSQRRISAEVLRDHPEWDEYLLDKNLYVCLDRDYAVFVNKLEEKHLSNKDLLFLIRKYGRYLNDDRIHKVSGSELNEIDENIKNTVVDMIKSGFDYGEDAIPLVGEIIPEYFLDANAPQELKDRYYYVERRALTFDLLKQHRDWLPYLENKEVVNIIAKGGINKRYLKEYFDKCGTKQGLIVGMKNPDSVVYMIIHGKIDLLLEWVNRTKFVPHFIVMTMFPVGEMDKFMAAGKLWSQIMRIPEFNSSPENIEAMLKAAYSFGVFDGDREGFTKFMQLFTSIPEVITEEEYKKIEEIAKNWYYVSEETKEKDIETLHNSYYLGEDGKYHVSIDYQQHREEAEIIRKMASIANLDCFLSPNRAHQIFGGFDMRYDPTFRDFFMAHAEEIIDPYNEYITFAAAIQKNWDAIRIINANRVLTLQLAKDFVISNKYMGVETGNDELSVSSASAGYTQAEFDKLQEIYNYGKTRVHNSIPRITGVFGRYNYELMRLDDAYATAIGTLANCCQEIGNEAEVCMEHSMVSEHGRIFVIRDQEGNIEAQSWVWRNQNVLCFDNIEIPHNAFKRAAVLGLGADAYADEILEIYKKAAEEIIAADEAKYKELLEAGRISQEQYDKLRIRKVTSGIGYNDIEQALYRGTEKDKGTLTKPLVFHEPVKLTKSLYIRDSQKGQQIIAGDAEVEQSEEETLPVYTDEFRVIDREKMTEQILLMMEKIEFAARDNTSGYLSVYDKNRIMESIARNYGLDPTTTKIVIHPNFYIIYCVSDNRVVIADIVRNTKINQRVSERDITDIANLQIGLALKQIKGDMEFDVSMLEPEELEIFNQALADEKMDSERGFSHGM